MTLTGLSTALGARRTLRPFEEEMKRGGGHSVVGPVLPALNDSVPTPREEGPYSTHNSGWRMGRLRITSSVIGEASSVDQSVR